MGLSRPYACHLTWSTHLSTLRADDNTMAKVGRAWVLGDKKTFSNGIGWMTTWSNGTRITTACTRVVCWCVRVCFFEFKNAGRIWGACRLYVTAAAILQIDMYSHERSNILSKCSTVKQVRNVPSWLLLSTGRGKLRCIIVLFKHP